MTKELFISCIDTLFQRHDRDQFWEVWNQYPEYVQELYYNLEKDVADPNSQQRKESDIWWTAIKSQLVKELGENWVQENCVDE